MKQFIWIAIWYCGRVSAASWGGRRSIELNESGEKVYIRVAVGVLEVLYLARASSSQFVRSMVTLLLTYPGGAPNGSSAGVPDARGR